MLPDVMRFRLCEPIGGGGFLDVFCRERDCFGAILLLNENMSMACLSWLLIGELALSRF